MLIFIPYPGDGLSAGGLPFGTGVDEQTEAQVTARLAAQIPADYEMECLKAQAVIVRTNLYREMEKEAGAEDGAGKRKTPDPARIQGQRRRTKAGTKRRCGKSGETITGGI